MFAITKRPWRVARRIAAKKTKIKELLDRIAAIMLAAAVKPRLIAREIAQMYAAIVFAVQARWRKIARRIVAPMIARRFAGRRDICMPYPNVLR